MHTHILRNTRHVRCCMRAGHWAPAGATAAGPPPGVDWIRYGARICAHALEPA